MIKLYTKIKLFFEYRSMIKSQSAFLLERYGLSRNIYNEIYTTIVLTDAPDELKSKYGESLAEYEIKKYITDLDNYFGKLGMNEMVNVYEIKKINSDLYGVAFGYSQMNNKRMYLLLYSMLFSTIGILFGLLLFIN